MPAFAGFFSGSRYAVSGDPKPTAGALTVDRAEKIAAYLTSGHKFAMLPMRSRDLFQPDKRLPTLSYMTDGDWIWPSDLIYYVTAYRVAIPAEVEAKAVGGGRLTQPIRHDVLDRVKDAFTNRRGFPPADRDA